MFSWNLFISTRCRRRFPGVILAACFAVLVVAPRPAVAQRVYVVRPGDTLSGIAEKELGSTNRLEDILRLNPEIKDPNWIMPGDRIRLPAGGRAPRATTPLAPREKAGPLFGEGALQRLQNSLRDFADGRDPGDSSASAFKVLLLVVGTVIAAQFVIYLLVGALFLWIGAMLVRIENLTFGLSFRANFIGCVYSAMTGALLIVLCVLVLRGFGDRLGAGVIGVGAGFILVGALLQYFAYVYAVKRTFETSMVRAFFACLFSGLAQGISVVVLGGGLGLA